jgi:hypothetical protein
MIRPANMRTTHGVRHPCPKVLRGYSVSAVQCVEDILLDHFATAISGSGMDAPVNLPVGSVKAFFNITPGDALIAFGFCQRTTVR